MYFCLCCMLSSVENSKGKANLQKNSAKSIQILLTTASISWLRVEKLCKHVSLLCFYKNISFSSEVFLKQSNSCLRKSSISNLLSKDDNIILLKVKKGHKLSLFNSQLCRESFFYKSTNR